MGQRSDDWLVFVGHSGVDTWVAKQIASDIRDCGATPFLDAADIEVGADLEQDILGFLERADELVVLLTPWALERPYVWAEVWLDQRDIAADEALRNSTENRLRESDAIVAVVSRENVRNPNVFFELGVALGAGKLIIPVLADDVEGSSIPFDLQSRPHAAIGPPERTAREVASAIRAATEPKEVGSMYSLSEIRSWSTERIRDEIEDQRRWVRDAERDGFGDFSASNEYLSMLRQVLDERRE